MPFTWASVVPAGTVPKDYPRHFDGLSARPVAPVSRRSPRNRAHRGPRAGFFGVGRACRPGPASAASRSLQKIVGAIVGRRLELGANTYRVLVHPTSTEGVLIGLGPTPIRAGEGLRAPVAMVVSPRPERAGQADQDGRPSGAARAAIDLSVVRGVGSSTVVRGSVGSYRPVIAGAKLREGITTILPRGESAPGSRLVFNALSPHWRGTRRRQRWTRSMVHGKNRIPYRIDRRLTGLAGPDYAAPISFGLPIEPEDSQYGESRF